MRIEDVLETKKKHGQSNACSFVHARFANFSIEFHIICMSFSSVFYIAFSYFHLFLPLNCTSNLLTVRKCSLICIFISLHGAFFMLANQQKPFTTCICSFGIRFHMLSNWFMNSDALAKKLSKCCWLRNDKPATRFSIGKNSHFKWMWFQETAMSFE